MTAYQCQYSTSWLLVLAFITLTILPAIPMFLLAQRWVVAGLTAGAVKALYQRPRWLTHGGL
jgi:raffinose/stachyose/melibiose transport system permease protein